MTHWYLNNAFMQKLVAADGATNNLSTALTFASASQPQR
jgi:hypothetical protein